jgi:hypothetical protein
MCLSTCSSINSKPINTIFLSVLILFDSYASIISSWFVAGESLGLFIECTPRSNFPPSSFHTQKRRTLCQRHRFSYVWLRISFRRRTYASHWWGKRVIVCVSLSSATVSLGYEMYVLIEFSWAEWRILNSEGSCSNRLLCYRKVA